ncbi:hypothetical protein PSTG_11996 [Puccinia striiformis f. sp. tritici PST-78]|uniref:Uncharacterized protein n=1 Tax=Puccinia striiformis f. sp. tritici PST-78 TaxID=1165861 RepID=A0A0L0V5U3_9BASI|nr:hypothetical protein PSTG_11996 [Puccinia striiformis f. sp. tritici PST-78]
MLLLSLTNATRLYNPFLELEGEFSTTIWAFDGHMIDWANMWIVKYLARDFVHHLLDAAKKEIIARLHSFDRNGVNIDLMKPKYLIRHILSIVGRDFKVILQTAPFVFFGLMTPEQKSIWSALCKLTPFTFQTKISDMAAYQVQLRLHVDHFLAHLIKASAQWVNKPKIHMLRHLGDSILRFGPAVIFSTKKFESFNGVVRQSSIHSNKQAPGRDIAVAFDSHACLRFVISGGRNNDPILKTWTTASRQVTQVFHNNRNIQRALGYNEETAKPRSPHEYPKFLRNDGCWLVGQVNSLWEVVGSRRASCYMELTGFDFTGADGHYEMCGLKRTVYTAVVNAKDLAGSINVQHNRQLGNCLILKTKSTFMERQETSEKTDEVVHSDHNHYIINAASLRNAELHRLLSNMMIDPITGDQ